MKNKTESANGEEDGGTSVLQPAPVSEEFIRRLAGRCEEIFPLNGRQHDALDDDLAEMENLLKRLSPAPVNFLFREQCCALMCAESERGLEGMLSRLSAASMLDFSVNRMARAMADSDAPDVEANNPAVSGRHRFFYGSGLVAALVAALFLIPGLFGVHPEPGLNNTVTTDPEHQKVPLPEQQGKPYREPTIFEKQGGDERVPVLAPAVIRRIVPQKEY